MHCPICRNYSLQVQDLDAGLKARRCPHCGGLWIGSYVYWKWKESTGQSLGPATTEQGANLPVCDSTAAKLCPECGHFLRRYPVGRDVGFSLDRCGNCGGMWFDRNEWESLSAKGLHVDVHAIFSNMWQNQIREARRQQAAESIYMKMLGPDDYKKACEIKDWLSKHPHKSEIRAFLDD